MFDQTCTIVLESPRGEDETLENVVSIYTQEDGTLSIRTEDGVFTRGWDWQIRDIKTPVAGE